MGDFLDNLIPRPCSVTVLPGASQTPTRVECHTPGLDVASAGQFTRLAGLVLRDWLKPGFGHRLTVEVSLVPDLAGPPGRRIPAQFVPEAYELVVDRQAALRATDYSGLQRGVQTLKQVLENAAQFRTLPHFRVTDWPRIAHRGIHFDLAREMEYRPAFLRRVVERVAYFKMNTLHLYLENKFAYPSCPQAAPANVMTPKQAQELCRYAERLGVTIIPQIPTLGHMEHFLHGDLAEMREDPANPFNLCPCHPRARPFLAGLIRDVAEAFRAPFIHAGYDESSSGACARCRERGTASAILADHLNWLNEQVKQCGARTMIYGDKFLSRDQFQRSDAVNGGSIAEADAALDRVDRDILITDWHYTSPYGETTRHFVERGFEVHIASATNIYWHDSLPLLRGQHWIVDTTDRAIEAGATGAFNTNWEYYRGQFFDNTWYFQALAAERQWSAAKHDFMGWGRRFSSRFWGVETDYYSDLVALAEATPTERTRKFLDSPVLADFPVQVRYDYIQVGDHIGEQARRLRKEALRNRDTLRLLDIYGVIIRYVGVRAYQQEVARCALKAGDGARVAGALSAMLAEAERVASRLEQGYRLYGGAVQDRGRIQAHKESLARMLTRLAQLAPEALKTKALRDLDTGAHG